MADTVKKSRIVSEPECLAPFDEDTSLQDIINEEFTQRLKTCMQDDNFIETNDEHIALTYETGEVVLRNGEHKKETKQEQIKQPVLEETIDLTENKTDLDSTVLTEPIQEEIKQTESPISPKESPTKVKEVNGIVTPNIQEVIPSPEDLKASPTNGLNHSTHSEEIHQTSPEDSFVNKEIPSPEEDIESPFDNVTVTDVDNENLTAKERFLSTVKDIEDDNKQTIKDRMFLSTDSACLLFTQTVVQSPMLTPTEENYDFLQGLRQNSPDSTVQNSEIVPILENFTGKTENVEVEIDDISEISAENEVCLQLESSNSEEISEPLNNEEDIKNITSKFILSEVSVTDGEMTAVKTHPRPVFKSTPTIVEHLVDDIDPDNDEIIEDYSITHEDTQTVSEEVKGMSVQHINDEKCCGYEENVSCKLAEEENNQNKLRNGETGAQNETQSENLAKITFDENMSRGDQFEVENYNESVSKNDELASKNVESTSQNDDLSPTHDESLLKNNESPLTPSNIDKSPLNTDECPSNIDEYPSNIDESPSNIDESPSNIDESTSNVDKSSSIIDESHSKHVEPLQKTNEPPPNDELPSEINKEVTSPTKVSEISKIFAAKNPEDLKEEIVSPKSPVLDEIFEDIKKTKEVFEKMSSEETILKSCDLIKRLSDSSLGTESECATNIVCRNVSSTITSESSFVETRTEVNSSQDKVLKKKKSKKSKKDNKKENISVCDTNSNDDDNLSHVSVKNLCRSFSDLSSLGNKNLESKITKNRTVCGRTKSMSDIRKEDVTLENVFNNVSVKSLKSSFSKFDALQKKSVLHVRSSDTGKAQEKFNGNAQIDTSACKSCNKQVFQMEQIKAEKAIWHKNCFRCQECNKQLNVDTYQSNEGVLYCKPHFKALFTPKAVEDEPQPMRPRKHELIIRENQPVELPPDVVRASDKPDLGLEELQNLNVKERFQVFEHHENQENSLERTPSTVNVKRSPSILSKLAKFQSKGMDIGVADDSLNGVPVEESSSEEEEEEEEIEGEDAELVRARRAQREKPMHFSNMSDVMSKWESGNQMSKEERREERKQEIQSIRSRLFMGKQAKIKEMYQQAVLDSSSGAHIRKSVPLDTELSESARCLRERFERGEQLSSAEQQTLTELDDAAVFEAGISRKSRSIFLELDANASKPPRLQPAEKAEVKRAREVFMSRQASEDVVKASDQVDAVQVKTADISSRFKFFETYKEPEKQRKEFRITPPRDGQTKGPSTPEEAPQPVAEPDDTIQASASHTATRMLNVFRQMEESAGKEQVPVGPKPLKRFTPPPEPQRPESDSEEEYSEEEDDEDEIEEQKIVDEDLIEAQKAARAKQLRAKFEKWEANEIKREQNNSSVNIAEEMADADSQIESAKSLCARFESMRESSSDKERTPRVKVNRFVDTTNNVEICKSCEGRVYPLEKVSCHNNVYHKNCFRCKECNSILRMDSYTYNQGLLYCLPHFKRLFISKGNYEAGFGLDQHKEKWNTVS